MTLQPPPGFDPRGYGPRDRSPEPPAPVESAPDQPTSFQRAAPDDAVRRAMDDARRSPHTLPERTVDTGEVSPSDSVDLTPPVQAPTPGVVPARRRPSAPPVGLSIVGGNTVSLHRTVALDRLASGFGYLTVEWLVRQRGWDLLALQERSTVAARGNTLTIDLTRPLGRVLIGTGTQGTMQLPPSQLRVSNGSTQVLVPIDGGTSLGVWPRLTISRVDEFIVLRNERDPLSGILGAVAGAYGYDERNFVITHTHLLG